MILGIPYQILEIENIHLSLFSQDKYGKTIARLAYKDPSISFQDVSILTPPLKVIDYNSEYSRLRIDLLSQPPFFTKINSLHEYIISTFYTHQTTFLNESGKTHDEIRGLFYSLLDKSVLSLYIYPSLMIQSSTTDASLAKKISDLKPDDLIRCIIRLQGISLIHKKDRMYLRLHHTVPLVWQL
jgi:hypothetical protein